MSLLGDIGGALLSLGGGALTMFGGPVGAAIGAPLTGVGNSLFSSSMNSDNVKAAEDYNSPVNQMARYKAAGLNPNLIYTQGSAYQAPPVVTSTPTPASGQMTMVDYQQKTANVDNTKQAIQTAMIEQILKKYQIANLDANTDLTQFNTAQGMRLSDFQVSQAQANLQKTLDDDQFTVDADTRQMIMLAPNYAQAIENIALAKAHQANVNASTDLLKQQLTNAKIQQLISQYEVDLNKTGVSKSDGLIERTVVGMGSKIADLISKPIPDSMFTKPTDGSVPHLVNPTSW